MWDGNASRYTPEQYEDACVLDRKVCGGKWVDVPAKTRCSLPIKNPGGGVNPDALPAAAARIAAVTEACPAAIAAAKAKLRAAYKTLGKPVPPSVGAKGPKVTYEEMRLANLRAEIAPMTVTAAVPNPTVPSAPGDSPNPGPMRGPPTASTLTKPDRRKRAQEEEAEEEARRERVGAWLLTAQG